MKGAPHATQVADRWHIWRNLGEAVERTVTRHRDHLQALTIAPSTRTDTFPPAAPPVAQSAPSRSPADRQDRIATRTREHNAAVHALLEQGQGLRKMSLGGNTVRRFARAASPEDLLVHNGTGRRLMTLEAYDAYLRKRWAEGCTNAELLHQELQTFGYRGSGTNVRQYVRP